MSEDGWFDTSMFPTEWVKFFAWMPVIINGRIYWLTDVYRRQIIKTETETMGDGRTTTEIRIGRNVTQYGTILDVLKDN